MYNKAGNGKSEIYNRGSVAVQITLELLRESLNTIHSKALKDFIEKLLDVCSVNNVQVFLTTHSLEAIDIILDDCRSRLEDMSVYHIRNKHQQTNAKKYSGEKLLALRNEIGFDVR